MLNLCLEAAPCYDGRDFERLYNSIYKPLLSFLYSHPKVLFSFNFSGPQLSFLNDVYPESIDILRELTSRHQVEVLGGGYYTPLFPLLFPVDRSGQIEKMTSLLRATVGKRPLGMSLFASVWDPSLVTVLQSCGMLYVHLESSLIPHSSSSGFYPVIVYEQGKSLRILPTQPTLLMEEGENYMDWAERLKKTAGDAPSQVMTFSFSPCCKY